jgi:hypothetical protein
LKKLDIDEKDIENKSGEIQDVFTDLESEIDIKVQFKFEGDNKFLSHLYITLSSLKDQYGTEEDITNQIHKIREIGKSLSRLENCMQFYSGNAEYCDDYGDIREFSIGLDFFSDYNEDSRIEDDEGDESETIGIITQLTILFHYA